MPIATKQKLAEFFRFSFEESEDGHWIALLEKPLSVNLPIEEQQEHLFKYAYLDECNQAFASMYGYSNPKELVGVRFPQLLLLSDPANLDAIRKFLSSGYTIKNVETHERAKNGEPKYFLNDARGIIENNHLVRVWGRQQDITSSNIRRLSFNHLSPLQLRVLKLTAEGKTLKESSQLLNIKERKVDAVRSQLKKKFGVKTTPELIARAIHLGLVDSGELTCPNQLGLFQEE